MNFEKIYELEVCPVCGFELGFKPWDGGCASFEICSCCGIQFGYEDAAPEQREQRYFAWRERWIAAGRKWWSSGPTPPDFDPDRQLTRLTSITSA